MSTGTAHSTRQACLLATPSPQHLQTPQRASFTPPNSVEGKGGRRGQASPTVSGYRSIPAYCASFGPGPSGSSLYCPKLAFARHCCTCYSPVLLPPVDVRCWVGQICYSFLNHWPMEMNRAAGSDLLRDPDFRLSMIRAGSVAAQGYSDIQRSCPVTAAGPAREGEMIPRQTDQPMRVVLVASRAGQSKMQTLQIWSAWQGPESSASSLNTALGLSLGQSEQGTGSAAGSATGPQRSAGLPRFRARACQGAPHKGNVKVRQSTQALLKMPGRPQHRFPAFRGRA